MKTIIILIGAQLEFVPLFNRIKKIRKREIIKFGLTKNQKNEHLPFVSKDTENKI